jgi:hypothetical protein
MVDHSAKLQLSAGSLSSKTFQFEKISVCSLARSEGRTLFLQQQCIQQLEIGNNDPSNTDPIPTTGVPGAVHHSGLDP